MAAKNNFKRLEEEERIQNPHTPPSIENNVKGTVRMFQFMGDVVELYLPRVFDMIVALIGGEKKIETEIEEGGDADNDSELPMGEQKPDLN